MLDLLEDVEKLLQKTVTKETLNARLDEMSKIVDKHRIPTLKDYLRANAIIKRKGKANCG
jgi:uncharacterized protein YqgQ